LLLDGLVLGGLRRWCQYDVTRHIYIHVSLVPASLPLLLLEDLPDFLLTISIPPHVYVGEVWFLLFPLLPLCSYCLLTLVLGENGII
jgi:hypothetical protein